MTRAHLTVNAVVEHGRRLLHGRLFSAAAEVGLRVLQSHPNDFDALLLVAHATIARGDFHGAVSFLERCLAIRPREIRAIVDLARALHMAGRSSDAMKACDHGLRIDPGRPSLVSLKSTIYDQRGDQKRAFEVVQPFLQSDQTPGDIADAASRALYGLKRFDEALGLARQAALNPLTHAVMQRTLWFQVAKIHDHLGQYDDAIAACRAAHAVLSHASFEPARFQQYINDLISTFREPNLGLIARGTIQSQAPVFIVGMPRSGTTLVEQIVHAHPDGFGAGELPDIENAAKSIAIATGSLHPYPHAMCDFSTAHADALATAYLDHLTRLAPNKARICNKSLELWEHVGLINCVFPGARVIHCRRDAMDTCMSCYTRAINPERFPWAKDLDHLGLVYREYERLMEHWHGSMDVPILTIQYEDLVRSQERISRELIDFLGLPWDDACLEYWKADRTVMTLSYDQVNRPIYDSSMGRWRNYERHLDSLKRSLGVRS